jgi:hypothetical protein
MRQSRLLLLLLLACGATVSGFFLWKFTQGLTPGAPWLPEGGLSWWAIPAAVGLQVVAHGLRAANARRLLGVVRPVGLRPVFGGMAVGFLFNAVLPFRLGELVRAHVTGKQMAVSRTVVLFTILFERAVDSLVLAMGAGAVLLLARSPSAEWVGTFARLAGAVCVVGLLVAGMFHFVYRQDRRLLRLLKRFTALFNDRLRDRMRFVLWSIIYGMHTVFRRAPLGRYLATAVGMWALYAGSIAVLLVNFAPDSAPLARLATALSAYLGVSVPSGPGFLGTYHFYFGGLARAFLGPDAATLGLSVVSWAVLMVPFALVGLGFVTVGHLGPLTLQSPASALEPLKNKLHRESDVSREFSHFLDEYFSGEAISHVLSTCEMRGDFRMVKTFKGGSNASTLLVWSGERLRVKKVTLSQHAEKLKAQYDWLRSYEHLGHLPRPTDEVHGQGFYAFDLEYREDYVPFFQFLHSESLERSRAVLDGVLDFMYGRIYQLQERVDGRAELERYLREKVLDKVKDAAALSASLQTLVEAPSLVINGRRYDNLSVCLEQLQAHPRAMRELGTFYRTPIHGDLTVDNLIVSRATGDFLILDPNNENAISDPVVDLGKLYQSLHSGYEFLVQLASVRVEGEALEFEDSLSSRYSELFAHLRRRLEERLPPEVLRTVLFHEAVHYCRMLTYRARINPHSLPAFYATAVRLFNEFNAQYASPEREQSAPAEEGLRRSA